MSKKKRPNKVPTRTAQNAAVPRPVVHGDAFRTFIAEAQSIGNEVAARREYDADVVEYLEEKGLFEDWARWREMKINARSSAR
jgi:hypothetical protein